jgi:hypothetical protein
MSIPVSDLTTALNRERSLQDHALESEAEDDVIHVEPISRVTSKIGGGGYDPPTQDLGPHGGNTEDEGGFIVEKGYGVPILASDEVLFRPEAQFMQPAIEPEMERRGDEYIGDVDTPPSGRRSSTTHSRSNSIPTITHTLPRFGNDDREGTGTPLEDVKEYEPLFPEDEEKDRSKSAPGAVQKLQRPDVLARHHFPSQDIWEDTPSSMMYETTVQTPQLPDDTDRSAEHEPKDFESRETEKARQSNITEEDKQSFLPEETKRLAKSGHNASLLADRPGLRQRFPSQDIWEDTPDSQMHTATVGNEQEAADESAKAVPQIPSRPTKKTSMDENKESLPSEERRAPSIPGRPKPQVPARPSKLQSRWSEEGVPLAKTISGGSAEGADSSTATKAKPPVPARPAGGKIAALQANFMSDLNKRLQLGPVAPKKDEPKEEEAAEQEKAPLADARKGRARGPQRRKPGVSPGGTAEEASTPPKPSAKFAISKPVTIWEVDEGGDIKAPSIGAASEPLEKELANPMMNKAESLVSADELPTDIKLMSSSVKAPEKVSGDDAVTSTMQTESTQTQPESSEPEKEIKAPQKQSSTDSSMQTGEQHLSITKDIGTGEMEDTTVYLGGRAPEPGTIVVRGDGEVHVGSPDSLGGIEKTGHGM